jgi:hypothetical protein
MHPNLKFAHAWLLKGPLGVPDHYDMMLEDAKCWIACAPKGSTFQPLVGELLYDRYFEVQDTAIARIWCHYTKNFKTTV